MSDGHGIPVITITSQRGLPCRGGCTVVFTPLSSGSKEHLAQAVGQRDGHELRVHAYAHVATAPPDFYSHRNAAHGFVKRAS